MASSDFNELLQQAEALSNNIDTVSDLPKVERSLRQVLEASNELYNRVRQTGSHDIQANLLLGSKGIDLPQISQKLDSISAKRSFDPLDPIADNDVQNFLENEIENCILSVIESNNEETLNDIINETWEHQIGQWTKEKNRLINALTGPSRQVYDLQKTVLTPFKNQKILPGMLASQEQIYTRIIIDYNRAIIKGGTKPLLVNILAEAALELKDSKVNEMWEMLKYMTDLPSYPKSDDPIQCRYSKPIQMALVQQAKKYLQDRYKTYMMTVINENLRQAQRGGIPGTYYLVRSFVGVRLQGEYFGLMDGFIDERPLWPMVYYCLRSGDLAAALHCIRKAAALFEEVASILEALIQGKHDESSTFMSKLRVALRFQYRRQVRNATDPFKRAIFCILGRCDVRDEHSEVARSADDYLWLQLNFIRYDESPSGIEKNSDQTSLNVSTFSAGFPSSANSFTVTTTQMNTDEEFITYGELQRTILEEYGESHYDAENQPHVYFQMLLLTSQFEASIEFLSRFERFRAHAVHFAIAISELGLLGGPPSSEAPILARDAGDPVPARRLNIARLILYYVKRFEISNPLEAIHYYYALRYGQAPDGTDLFSSCVADLAFQSRDFSLLFGIRQPNGLRSRGIVDEFADAGITVEALILDVADQHHNKGLFEDAVLLYDLGDNQEKALTILCRLLPQVVHLPPKQGGSLRERLQALTMKLSERYTHAGFNCSAAVASSFIILRDLLLFFDHFHNQQYSLAMEVLQHLQLVPLDPNEVTDRVSAFKRLSADVCRVFPDILLATMDMLLHQHQQLRANATIIGSTMDHTNITRQLQHVRDQAKALTNFAGCIPYRLSGEINTKMVQMEILMH